MRSPRFGRRARTRGPPVPYPDNAGYMIAAYLVTAVVVVGYALSLLYRLRKER